MTLKREYYNQERSALSLSGKPPLGLGEALQYEVVAGVSISCLNVRCDDIMAGRARGG